MNTLKKILSESECNTIECLASVVSKYINEGKNEGKISKHFKKHSGKYALGTAMIGAGALGIAHGMTNGRRNK